METPCMNAPFAAKNDERRLFLGLLLAGLFVIGLLAPTFQQLFRIWLLDANYSHGFFIVPISAWLASRVLRDHPLPEHGDPVQGTFTLFAGLIFQMIGVVLRFLPIEFVAMMLV